MTKPISSAGSTPTTTQAPTAPPATETAADTTMSDAAQAYRQDMFEFCDNNPNTFPGARQAQASQATCRAVVSQRLVEMDTHSPEVMDAADRCNSEMSCMSKDICSSKEDLGAAVLREGFTVGDLNAETEATRLGNANTVYNSQPWLHEFELSKIEDPAAQTQIKDFAIRQGIFKP